MNDDKHDAFLIDLGMNLFKIRTHMKLSRLQLAKAIGTDEKYLRLVESGDINAGIATWYKISIVLELPLSELFLLDGFEKIYHLPERFHSTHALEKFASKLQLQLRKTD